MQIDIGTNYCCLRQGSRAIRTETKLSNTIHWTDTCRNLGSRTTEKIRAAARLDVCRSIDEQADTSNGCIASEGTCADFLGTLVHALLHSQTAWRQSTWISRSPISDPKQIRNNQLVVCPAVRPLYVAKKLLYSGTKLGEEHLY